MKIGLLSDTHSYLDKTIFEHFKGVDEVWHAGDIGELSLLRELEAFKPTRAVFGNIDNPTIQQATEEDLIYEVEGCKILMTHIAAKPPRYNKRVKQLITDHQPNILVCGHSHILKVEFDKANNLLFINPGACGRHGFHRMRTILRFEINNGRPEKMEVIELGLRGK